MRWKRKLKESFYRDVVDSIVDLIDKYNEELDKCSETKRIAQKLKTKLEDYADLVLDTHAEVGDVVLDIDGTHKMNHVGTITGNVIAQMLTAETYRYLTENGHESPVLLSANLKGADVHNRRLSDKYAGRWNS